MSAPQGRSRRRAAEEDDEVVSMVGQRVWFVDQIEPVGTIRAPIEVADKVIGFVIEDERSNAETPIVRRVQRSRVRKYGDRYFLVTSWFAKADQAAKELEKQLARGLPPDRDRRFWESLSQRGGPDVVTNYLAHVAPPTYGVAGQLAAAAEGLSQDLARAAVVFRRVQRALVANQSVMSPEEYAQFVDEARKWSRTVRLVLMSLEFLSRALPHAQIDVRNPDAPLPSGPVYIPFESLLDIHTPSGEGKARERPPSPAIEAGGEEEFGEVFGEVAEDEGSWQEAEDFEAVPAEGAGAFAPVKPLKEYDEDAGFERVEPEAESFEPVGEAEAQAVETFEEVAPEEEPVQFEEVAEPPQAPVPPPSRAAAAAKPAPPKGPPVPPPIPSGTPAPAAPAKVVALPEEEDEVRFTPGRRAGSPEGQWLTPPPPPPPKPAQMRQAERHERLRDKSDLDAIIAASLGKTPKKAPSKASQGEISGVEEGAPKPAADALSRELASLLEKSKRK